MKECSRLIIESTETELGPGCDCALAVVAAEDLAENCLFKRVLMPLALCSSRTCILHSLISTKTESQVRLRTLLRILPKTLNSRSHDAELAETDRMRLANTMNGEVKVDWPGTVNDVKIRMGSSCRFYILRVFFWSVSNKYILG